MRILKFRQPRIAQGKFHHWHYWGYVDDKEGHFVAPLPPNTGGDSYQFTGLLDKQDTEIYEGDKIKVEIDIYNGTYICEYDKDLAFYKFVGEGEWLTWEDIEDKEGTEIIGNIYQPEEQDNGS